MPRQMTPAERLIGRRLPPPPTNIDIVMARYVKEDGAMRARFEPSEAAFKPAHRQARKNGWIRQVTKVTFEGARPMRLWRPTETGEAAAREAALRVRSRRAEWEAWGRACAEAYKAGRRLKPEPDGDAPAP
ncbi:hypothetical protein [Defluviimonas salinarum]|uniref:Uncharacterized protein n=1 Tax=Defluviimonas salinarum TaxID=2992147 RepID=A0ABT3JAF5_9RHOB|nr:hypothetical protein [Defluviimonas salinarum]MCW3784661.1 hypothetical protein [Defluviimonas salinarum]